jgi:hypothetical protein
MDIFIVRISIFTILPLLAATLVARIDRSVHTRPRAFEIYLIYLFGLGVTGSGIGGFIGHLFLSDVVAESVGWPTGSPFQQEMGFANLALGVLGLIAIARRDGFREATVLAVTIIGVGATVVHVIDIVQTGNLAPGNTVQNVANLVRPLLLIWFLWQSRRAEASVGPLSQATGFSAWHTRHAQAVGWMTGMVSAGFGMGFAMGKPALLTVLGVLAGAGAVAATLARKTRVGSPLDVDGLDLDTTVSEILQFAQEGRRTGYGAAAEVESPPRFPEADR